MNRISVHFPESETTPQSRGRSQRKQSMNREFIQCLTRDYNRIFGYIMTFVPVRQDAEDLMQETIFQIWNKFDDFDHKRDFFRWAVGFARVVIRQYHRDLKPDQYAFDEELLSDMAITRLAVEDVLDLRREAMNQCIDSLAADQKNLLYACYIEHESIPAAAKALGRTMNALYSATHRIRKKLLDCIERRLKLMERNDRRDQ